MRKRFFCLQLAVITMVFALCMPVAQASAQNVFYTDFENCIDTIDASWVCKAGTAPVEYTEKGKSAVIGSVDQTQEVYRDFTVTDDSVKSVILRFSIKFNDFNCTRAIYARNAGGEYNIASLRSDGTVQIGGTTTVDGVLMETGKWYDIVIVNVLSTGEVKITVNDSGNIVTRKAYASKSGLGVYRINFVAFKGNIASKAYVDDIGLHALDYIPNDFVGTSSEKYDFEDYSATNGTTPPAGWKLQNLGNGDAKGESVEDYDGRAVKCTSNGTTSFELVKWFNSPISGKGFVESDFKRVGDSGIYIGVRGSDVNGNAVSKIHFFASMQKNGVMQSNGKDFGTLRPDTWYRLKFDFDTDAGIYTFSATSDEDNFFIEDQMPDNFSTVTCFEFFTPTTIGASEFIVDNVYIGAEEDFGIVGITPDFQTISASTDKIEITFTGEADTASDAVFMLNGDSSYFDGYEISSDKIILNVKKPLEYDRFYLFEALNLGADNNISVIATFNTQKKFAVSQHSVTSDANNIVGTVSAYATDGDTYQITLLLAIYNKDTGEMADLTATEAELISGEAELSVNLPVPEEAGTYEAYAYVWDGVDTMQSLNAPKVLEIN